MVFKTTKSTSKLCRDFKTQNLNFKASSSDTWHCPLVWGLYSNIYKFKYSITTVSCSVLNLEEALASLVKKKKKIVPQKYCLWANNPCSSLLVFVLDEFWTTSVLFLSDWYFFFRLNTVLFEIKCKLMVGYNVDSSFENMAPVF